MFFNIQKYFYLGSSNQSRGTQKEVKEVKHFFLVKMIDFMFGHHPEERLIFKDMNHKAVDRQI